MAHSVRHLGAQLDVRTLELSGAPDAILIEIGRLAEHVRRLARRDDSVGTIAA